MENTFNKIHYKTVTYTKNVQTDYYEKQPSKLSFKKLPFELKVETTQVQQIKQQGANEVICSRKKNGKYLFFTGLQKTNFINCYLGNDYAIVKGVKKLSIVVFQFTDNDKTLIVYYFNLFYKDAPTERLRFTNDFLASNPTP
jgi:hypothetical protein